MGGRDEEALELADEVAKETPTDEQVLYTLTLTWQGAGKIKASACDARVQYAYRRRIILLLLTL